MKANFSVGFIGCGNMAQAIISGMRQSDFDRDQIVAINRSPEKLAELSASLGFTMAESLPELVAMSDVLVLAVKPQVAPAMLEQLGKITAAKGKCLLSLAAGLPVSIMQQSLLKNDSDAKSTDWPIVRSMPNTPSLLGEGVCGLYATESVPTLQQNQAEQIMRAVGHVHWCEQESGIDAITAVSGSGPAYFFYMMEFMTAKAVDLGFSEQEAIELVTRTALGAAKLARESDDTPAELRRKITSPGGTTEQAILTFTNRDLHGIIDSAMQAAKDRCETLATELAKQAD